MSALPASRLFVAIAFGAVLWLGAALLIATLQAVGAFEGSTRVWLYVGVIPGTLPYVLLARRIANDTLVHFYTMATATATLLDGVALSWFPRLYGADPAVAGAVLLWGVGVGLVLAVVLERRS